MSDPQPYSRDEDGYVAAVMRELAERHAQQAEGE